MKANIAPKLQDPRKVAAALAKAIQELDRVCWETNVSQYTAKAREEMVKKIKELGYNFTTEYRITKQ